MACDICRSQDDLRSATRVLNRALRTVNRNLRRREEALVAQRDETVEALLSAPSEAEDALREIWERSSLLRENCGPDDYYTIVETAVAAIEAMLSLGKLAGTQPSTL